MSNDWTPGGARRPYLAVLYGWFVTVENNNKSTSTLVKEGRLDSPGLPSPPITPLPYGLIVRGLLTTPTKSIELR